MPAYDSGLELVADGTLDWAADTVAGVLVDNTYTYDAAHDTYSDITGELTDASYASIAVPSKSVAVESSIAIFKAGALDYDTLDNETPAGLILVHVTTGTAAAPDATDELIGFISSGFGATADGLGYIVRFAGDNFDEVMRLRNPA
jgi:hypothetical protein